MIDLRDIVRERGGDLYAGGRQAVIPGPGHSRKDRSLSLRVSEDGKVIFHSFANDSARDVMQYLGIERSGEASEATKADRERYIRLRDAERRRADRENAAFCAAVWSGSEPLKGSAAEAYLWSRGLIAESAPDLRYHPAAPRTKDPLKVIASAPAMLAIARDRDGRPAGLHATYIKPDGTGKAFGDRSRLMFGRLAECAVQLAPIGHDKTLAIGEGIETSLAYSAMKGVPAWAALSTSMLQAFHVPLGVRRLIIAADPDKGGVEAARRLAERARKLCDVVIDPAPEGMDWADVHAGGQ